MGRGHHHGTGQPLPGCNGEPLGFTVLRSPNHLQQQGHPPLGHGLLGSRIRLHTTTASTLEPSSSSPHLKSWSLCILISKDYEPISFVLRTWHKHGLLHTAPILVSCTDQNSAFQRSVTSALTYHLLLSQKFKCRRLPCRQVFYTYFNFVMAQVHFALKPKIYFPFQRESSVAILLYAFLYCRKGE